MREYSCICFAILDTAGSSTLTRITTIQKVADSRIRFTEEYIRNKAIIEKSQSKDIIDNIKTNNKCEKLKYDNYTIKAEDGSEYNINILNSSTHIYLNNDNCRCKVCIKKYNEFEWKYPAKINEYVSLLEDKWNPLLRVDY